MTQVGDHLVEQHKPWVTDDQEGYLQAVGLMFEQVELYAFDQLDGTPGWVILFQPDNCPGEALPYVAQFVGELLPLGISDAEARQWIKDAPNYQRGTIRSIARAAQRSLTGTRTVEIIERVFADGTADPDGDNFIVYTYTAQTPRPDQVWSDLQDVIPDDMICHYSTIAGPTWLEFEGAGITWADIEATYATWVDLETSTPGGSVWTR